MYWEGRKGYAYYETVLRFAKKYCPQGGSVLDVGSADCQYLLRLEQFKRKVALDIRSIPPIPGLEQVTADFMSKDFPEPFDLVLCLQVLEHVAEPGAFCRKLFLTGRVVVVSVPYLEAPTNDHPNNPIDDEKLKSWSDRSPAEREVVRDGIDRLVAVYPGGL